MPTTARRARSLVQLAVLALGFLGTGSVVGYAMRPAAALPAPKAPVTALVDIQRVLNEITESKDRRSRFDTRKTELEGRLKSLQEQAEQSKKQYDDTPPSNVERRAQLKAEAMKAAALAQAELKVFGEFLDIEAATMNRDMYQKCIATVRAYAQANAIDLVTLDDQPLTVPADEGMRGVTATISNKRVLYSASELDITDAVITKMNNDFAAGINLAPQVQGEGAAPKGKSEKPANKPKSGKN